MKRLWETVVLVLALNFIAVAGLVGWLYQSGKLDSAKVHAVREILFPPPAPPATQPATQPSGPPQPLVNLDLLVAQQAGRPAAEQVTFIQHAFDTQQAQLDRRWRELEDLRRQVELARAQLTRDRQALLEDRQRFETEKKQLLQVGEDKGFQDSLKLYMSMRPRQAKQVLTELDDATLTRYLQAMPPRTAAAIIKEFKAPEEIARIQQVMEKMRQSQASTRE